MTAPTGMTIRKLVEMLGVDIDPENDSPSLDFEVVVALPSACAERFPVRDDELATICGWEMHGNIIALRSRMGLPLGKQSSAVVSVTQP